MKIDLRSFLEHFLGLQEVSCCAGFDSCVIQESLRDVLAYFKSVKV